MANTNLITTAYRVARAQDMVNAASYRNYYAFAGTVTSSSNVIPQAFDDVYSTTIDVYRTMLFGKKIQSNNVLPAIPRYDYVSGTIYSQYDDADPTIYSKNFYAIVNATTAYHVWKCLDNAGGSPSTIAPNFADVDAQDDSYMTSDGYTWKYMYSVDAATTNTFATSAWFPVVANSAVAQSAIAGSIDSFEVLSSGNGYSNYLTGTFAITDVRLNGNSSVYAVSPTASPYAHFYEGCVIQITADPYGNSAGEYRLVTGYGVNATTKWVVLDRPFDNNPQNGAQYQMYPGIVVLGDGQQTRNAVAWAVINSATNTVNRVQILDRGAGYQYISSYVASSNVVGVGSNAVIRGVYSPPGGHGSDVATELGATSVIFAFSFVDTEQDTIFSNVSYQRIGVVRDPDFTRVDLTTANQSGQFLGGETAYKVSPVLLGGTLTTTYGNNVVVGVGTDLQNQLDVGERIVISANGGYQTTTINSIANSSQMTLDDAAHVSGSGVKFYIANSSANGVVVGLSTNAVSLANVSGQVVTGDVIVGAVSGARVVITGTSISNIPKNFSTYVGCPQYVGYVSAGTFQTGEVVSQGTAFATLASISSNGTTTTMYVTNAVGSFALSSNVVGQRSGASFQVSDKYPAEVVFGSGEVIYMENMSSIDRSLTRSETFRIVLQY